MLKWIHRLVRARVKPIRKLETVTTWLISQKGCRAEPCRPRGSDRRTKCRFVYQVFLVCARRLHHHNYNHQAVPPAVGLFFSALKGGWNCDREREKGGWNRAAWMVDTHLGHLAHRPRPATTTRSPKNLLLKPTTINISKLATIFTQFEKSVLKESNKVLHKLIRS